VEGGARAYRVESGAGARWVRGEEDGETVRMRRGGSWVWMSSSLVGLGSYMVRIRLKLPAHQTHLSMIDVYYSQKSMMFIIFFLITQYTDAHNTHAHSPLWYANPTPMSTSEGLSTGRSGDSRTEYYLRNVKIFFKMLQHF
jgi:hypothetical protein